MKPIGKLQYIGDHYYSDSTGVTFVRNMQGTFYHVDNSRALRYSKLYRIALRHRKENEAHRLAKRAIGVSR